MSVSGAVQGEYIDRSGRNVETPVGVRREVERLLAAAEAPAPDFSYEVPPIGAPLARRRRWGVHMQLAPLVDASTWGIGDYGSLLRLGRNAAAAGADFLAIGPTSWETVAADEGLNASPYSPVSRMLYSLLYVDVPALERWSALPRSERIELDRCGARLNLKSRSFRDDKAVLGLKAEAMRRVFEQVRYERPAAGCSAQDAALASALSVYLSRNGAARLYFGELTSQRQAEFVIWTQAVIRRQIAAVDHELRHAGMDIGLIGDLQVGCDGGGIDPDVFVGCYSRDLTIGTPPDDYVPDGQDWQLAFPVPHDDPQRACGQSIALIDRAAPIGGIRIDHVLGMERLWARTSVGAGAYVHFDLEAQMELAGAVVDSGKLVIGEDLGNIPPGLRQKLERRGVYGTDVLWWTRGADGSLRTGLTTEGRERSLLLTAFHDTTSTVGLTTGEDLRLLERLGRLGRDLGQAQAQRTADLAEFGVGPADNPLDALLSIYSFAFSARPGLVSIYYPDLLGLSCTENVPGTTSDDYPNWVLKYGDPAMSIDEQVRGSVAEDLFSLQR